MPADGAAGGPAPIDTRHGKGFYFGGLDSVRAAGAVADLIGRALDGQGEVLHRARNLVAAFPQSDLAPGGVALKVFAPPAGARKLPGMAGRGKAARHFEAAVRLLERGVPTPRPVAFVQERHGPRLGRGFLLMGLVAGTVEVREILKGRDPRFPRGPDEAFVRALGRFVSGLHAAGVVHRDLSDGNVLVSVAGGIPSFQVIDLNRARVRDKVGTLAAVRDVIRVGVTGDLRKPFLGACLGSTAPPAGIWCLYRLLKRGFELKLGLRRLLRPLRRGR